MKTDTRRASGRPQFEPPDRSVGPPDMFSRSFDALEQERPGRADDIAGVRAL